MLAKIACFMSLMILSFCVSPNVKHLSYKNLVYTFDRKHRFYERNKQRFLILDKRIGFKKMRSDTAYFNGQSIHSREHLFLYFYIYIPRTQKDQFTNANKFDLNGKSR